MPAVQNYQAQMDALQQLSTTLSKKDGEVEDQSLWETAGVHVGIGLKDINKEISKVKKLLYTQNRTKEPKQKKKEKTRPTKQTVLDKLARHADKSARKIKRRRVRNLDRFCRDVVPDFTPLGSRTRLDCAIVMTALISLVDDPHEFVGTPQYGGEWMDPTTYRSTHGYRTLVQKWRHRLLDTGMAMVCASSVINGAAFDDTTQDDTTMAMEGVKPLSLADTMYRWCGRRQKGIPYRLSEYPLDDIFQGDCGDDHDFIFDDPRGPTFLQALAGYDPTTSDPDDPSTDCCANIVDIDNTHPQDSTRVQFEEYDEAYAWGIKLLIDGVERYHINCPTTTMKYWFRRKESDESISLSEMQKNFATGRNLLEPEFLKQLGSVLQTGPYRVAVITAHPQSIESDSTPLTVCTYYQKGLELNLSEPPDVVDRIRGRLTEFARLNDWGDDDESSHPTDKPSAEEMAAVEEDGRLLMNGWCKDMENAPYYRCRQAPLLTFQRWHRGLQFPMCSGPKHVMPAGFAALCAADLFSRSIASTEFTLPLPPNVAAGAMGMLCRNRPTRYYRKQNDPTCLMEYIPATQHTMIPLQTSPLDAQQVKHYEALLRKGVPCTVWTFGLLQIEPEMQHKAQFSLHGFILDGHHKMQAAANTGLPIQVLCFIPKTMKKDPRPDSKRWIY